ncbi:hypothetical protein J4210_00615 [Candidatus Woesearchaeota archaeon]|nr:hypothetical protein [Candidatus Woesearchaeota archaeon]
MALADIIKGRERVFALVAQGIENVLAALSARGVEIDEGIRTRIKRLAGSLQALDDGIPALQASVKRAKLDNQKEKEFLAALGSESRRMKQLTQSLRKALNDQSDSTLGEIARGVRELREVLIGQELRVKKIK